MARSWEFAPNTRSSRVAVHFGSPVARSDPANTSLPSPTGFQAVRNELSQNVVFGDMDIAEALNKAQTDIEFRING